MLLTTNLESCWERGRGFGAVYKAYNKDSGFCVAVKIIRIGQVTEAVENAEAACKPLVNCFSPFIVYYSSMFRCKDELWIMLGEKC